MDARPLFVVALGLLGAGAAFAFARSTRNGPADGVNWSTLHEDVLDAGESLVSAITEQSADVPQDIAQDNIHAFLAVIRAAEGTSREPDPYRVVMGYGYTLQDLGEHPAITGEWTGAAFGNGQWSTAAGAYQFIKPTWIGLRNKLGLPDFAPDSQDAAAIELIRERSALEDVKAGRFAQAITKVRRVWASLPGAGYGQGERSMEWLAQVYVTNGGAIA